MVEEEAEERAVEEKADGEKSEERKGAKVGSDARRSRGEAVEERRGVAAAVGVREVKVERCLREDCCSL